jgi:hypothetical protein
MTREATVGRVGSSNLKDGSAEDVEARAEAKIADSAGGGRQPGNRQSGRTVRLEGRSGDASQTAGRKAEPEAQSAVQAGDGVDGEAGRLVRATQVNRRAGQQSERLSRRCKLATELNARRNGLSEGASWSAAETQNRTKGRSESRKLESKGWPRKLVRSESGRRSAMAEPAEEGDRRSEVGSKD